MAGRPPSPRIPAAVDSAQKFRAPRLWAWRDRAEEYERSSGKAVRKVRGRPNSHRSDKTKAFQDPTSQTKHRESIPVQPAELRLQKRAEPDGCGPASSTALARL